MSLVVEKKAPSINWYQTNDSVYFKIFMPNLSKTKIKIENNNFLLETDDYNMDFDFYDKIENYEAIEKEKYLQIILKKNNENSWNYLVKNNYYKNNIKVDWDNWKDDQEDFEENQYNFDMEDMMSRMGGMPGMPGIPGMKGMEDMEDMEDMEGMEDIDDLHNSSEEEDNDLNDELNDSENYYDEEDLHNSSDEEDLHNSSDEEDLIKFDNQNEENIIIENPEGEIVNIEDLEKSV